MLNSPNVQASYTVICTKTQRTYHKRYPRFVLLLYLSSCSPKAYHAYDSSLSQKHTEQQQSYSFLNHLIPREAKKPAAT